MATSTCDLQPADFAQAIAEQVSQLRMEMIRFNALNDPYTNIIDGGFTESNQGEETKTLVTSRIVTGHSLTAPAFTNTKDSCGDTGAVAKFGQTEFTAKLSTLRGEGPVICVNQARFAVENSYRMAEQTLKDGVKAVNAADIRHQLLALSGVKFVAKTNGTIGTLLTGGYNQVSVNFVGGVPDQPMTHKALVALSNYMRDNLSPMFFGEGAGQHFIGIFGSEQVEVLRNQADVKNDVLAIVQGGDRAARDAIMRYSFIDYPYRQIKLGIDQQPLRFNSVDANGFPVFIEPLIEVAVDHGVENQTNPNWSNAKYEVGFLVSKGTFRRLVPRRFQGEGSFRWDDPASMMGELQWFYAKDSCNKFGDFGNHIYDITRAFQAQRPHGVIPILYKRCGQDLGFDATCPDYTDFSDLSV